jgi:hypothetical protein
MSVDSTIDLLHSIYKILLETDLVRKRSINYKALNDFTSILNKSILTDDSGRHISIFVKRLSNENSAQFMNFLYQTKQEHYVLLSKGNMICEMLNITDLVVIDYNKKDNQYKVTEKSSHKTQRLNNNQQSRKNISVAQHTYKDAALRTQGTGDGGVGYFALRHQVKERSQTHIPIVDLSPNVIENLIQNNEFSRSKSKTNENNNSQQRQRTHKSRRAIHRNNGSSNPTSSSLSPTSSSLSPTSGNLSPTSSSLSPTSSNLTPTTKVKSQHESDSDSDTVYVKSYVDALQTNIVVVSSSGIIVNHDETSESVDEVMSNSQSEVTEVSAISQQPIVKKTARQQLLDSDWTQ